MLRQALALWGQLRLAAGLPVYVSETFVWLDDASSRHLLWADTQTSTAFVRVQSISPPRRPS